MTTPQFTIEDVKLLLQGLALERERLERQLLILTQREGELRAQFDLPQTATPEQMEARTNLAALAMPPRRRQVSAETREKLSKRMKARWATRKARARR